MRWPADLARSYSDPLRSVWGQRLNTGFESISTPSPWNPTITGFSTAGYTIAEAKWLRWGDTAIAWIVLDDDGTSVIEANGDLSITLPSGLAGVWAVSGIAVFEKTTDVGSFAAPYRAADGTVKFRFTNQSATPAFNADGDTIRIWLDISLAPEVTPNVSGEARPDALPYLWAPAVYETIATGTADAGFDVELGDPYRNRVVVVATAVNSADGTEDISGVTVDTKACTLIARAQNASGITTELWYVDEDGLLTGTETAGLREVAVTGPATPANVRVWAAVASGLAQDGPTDFGTDAATSGDPAVDVTTARGGLGFAVTSTLTGSAAMSPPAPLIERSATSPPGTGEASVLVGATPLPETDKTFTFGWSGTDGETATVAATWAPAAPPVSYYQGVNRTVAPPGGWTVDSTTQFVSQNGTYRACEGTRRWAPLSPGWMQFRAEIVGAITSASTHDIEIDLPPGAVLDTDGEQLLGTATVTAGTNGNTGPAYVTCDPDSNTSNLRVRVHVVDTLLLRSVNGNDWDLTADEFRLTLNCRVKLWTPAVEDWQTFWWAESATMLGFEHVSSAEVTTVPDDGTDGVNLDSITSAPTMLANLGALAGRPALRLGGTAEIGKVYGTGPDYSSGGITVVAFVNLREIPTTGDIIGSTGTSNTIEIASGPTWLIWDGALADGGTPTVGGHLLVAHYPGSGGGNITLKVDGAQVAQDTANGNEAPTIRLGQCDGLDAALLGVYEGNLIGTAIETRLEDYAQAHYGITLAGGGSGGGASPPVVDEPDDDTFVNSISWTDLYIAGTVPETNDDYCFENSGLTDPCESGDDVRGWESLGSDASHAVDVSFSGRPTLLDAAITVNGTRRPGVVFSGSDRLRSSPTSITGAWTAAIGFRRNATGVDQALWTMNGDPASGNERFGLVILDDTIGIATAFDDGYQFLLPTNSVGPAGGVAINDTDPHVVIVTWDPGTPALRLYLDDPVTAAASNTSTGLTWNLGSRFEFGRLVTGTGIVTANGWTKFFSGAVASALSQSDRQVVTEHAEDVYGV